MRTLTSSPAPERETDIHVSWLLAALDGLAKLFPEIAGDIRTAAGAAINSDRREARDLRALLERADAAVLAMNTAAADLRTADTEVTRARAADVTIRAQDWMEKAWRRAWALEEGET